MRTLMTGFGLAAAIVMSPAVFANNVAVVDGQTAIFSSNIAKQTTDGLRVSLKPQYDKLEQLRRDIQVLQERYQKDSSVMSDKDKQALVGQIQSKSNEFNGTAEGIQRRTEDSMSAMSKTISPKIEAIVEDLRKEGNYDIILEKKYVIYAVPAADLTKKITDRLNAAK